MKLGREFRSGPRSENRGRTPDHSWRKSQPEMNLCPRPPAPGLAEDLGQDKSRGRSLPGLHDGLNRLKNRRHRGDRGRGLRRPGDLGRGRRRRRRGSGLSRRVRLDRPQNGDRFRQRRGRRPGLPRASVPVPFASPIFGRPRSGLGTGWPLLRLRFGRARVRPGGRPLLGRPAAGGCALAAAAEPVDLGHEPVDVVVRRPLDRFVVRPLPVGPALRPPRPGVLGRLYDGADHPDQDEEAEDD
jgi:hypothetical protein